MIHICARWIAGHASASPGSIQAKGKCLVGGQPEDGVADREQTSGGSRAEHYPARGINPVSRAAIVQIRHGKNPLAM